jgi:OFA family oxalate/formate antiporter-like MFS transporter
MLASAFLMQMCLGATYSWSIFVRPLRDLTGLSQGLAQLPFTTFYFAFPLTLLFSGSLLRRLGPRRSAMCGALLFCAGWAVAGLGGGISFVFVVAGIGIISGVGVGFAYIVPIAVGGRWFPERPGLVTGIAVAGFAAGSALVGLSGEALMSGGGLSPFQSLAALGAAFLLLGLPAAARMEFPEGEGSTAAPPPARRELLRTKEFRQLFPAMVAGLAAGFAVNSNLKDLLPPGDLAAGAGAVTAFAIANATGRIAWGYTFDRMLPSSALRLNLLAQAVVLAGGYHLVKDIPSLLVFSAVAGFNYGGVLVLYASAAARRWGSMHVGEAYGLLFAANIIASPAPMAAGYSLDIFGSFGPAFLLFAALAAATAFRLGGSIDQRAGESHPPEPSVPPRSPAFP